jgi:hypothetical protein
MQTAQRGKVRPQEGQTTLLLKIEWWFGGWVVDEVGLAGPPGMAARSCSAMAAADGADILLDVGSSCMSPPPSAATTAASAAAAAAASVRATDCWQ